MAMSKIEPTPIPSSGMPYGSRRRWCLEEVLSTVMSVALVAFVLFVIIKLISYANEDLSVRGGSCVERCAVLGFVPDRTSAFDGNLCSCNRNSFVPPKLSIQEKGTQ
jgi:hypothetical protein